MIMRIIQYGRILSRLPWCFFSLFQIVSCILSEKRTESPPNRKAIGAATEQNRFMISFLLGLTIEAVRNCTINCITHQKFANESRNQSNGIFARQGKVRNYFFSGFGLSSVLLYPRRTDNRANNTNDVM